MVNLGGGLDRLSDKALIDMYQLAVPDANIDEEFQDLVAEDSINDWLTED